MQTALQRIFQEYKGILAADERPQSMDKRLELFNIIPGEETRKQYRTLLFTTPNLERTISGVILSEDTFVNHTIDNIPTREYLKRLGIVVGVKVDEGLKPYEEGSELVITQGLETLNEKCKRYSKEGAEFTKWRATIPVTNTPKAFIKAMATNMANYAKIALKYNLVPIIEPEVLLSGNHSIEETAKALEETISAVLEALHDAGCNPHQCILKTSFAVNGLENELQSADIVATKTLEVFKKVGLNNNKGFYGIVFLSGGLPSKIAIEYIQQIRSTAEEQNKEYTFRPPLTFSYGRALQEPALEVWQGKQENTYTAQIAFTQTLQHAIKKYKGVEAPPQASDGKDA